MRSLPEAVRQSGQYRRDALVFRSRLVMRERQPNELISKDVVTVPVQIR